MKLNGARAIIERLSANGADIVFGYPGSAVLPLYDELYKTKKITHILTAHEQGAAHAADGYARVSGKAGVVIATSGPGATNLVTGIASAHLDSVPMVAITGNVPVSAIGSDSFQEVDTVGITQPISKYNFLVKDVNKLERALDDAFRIAMSGRRGPVVVDIPFNAQTGNCEYAGGPPAEIKKNKYDYKIDEIIPVLKKSSRPLIYAGGGVASGGAENGLRLLSERIGAPVVFSMTGLASLPRDYPLNLGMSGVHGRYAANAAVNECDTLVALGVRFSDRATGDAEKYAKNKTIIHIDIDDAEINKNIRAQIGARCDVGLFLTELLRWLPEMKNEEWLARVENHKLTEQKRESKNSGSFGPRAIIETVRDLCCDGDTVIATDVGRHQIYAAHYYKFVKPRTFVTSGGLGAMGYGLGAAIGASAAGGKKRTVLFTGDGSFGMNLAELATAVTYGLPVVVIIFNNGALGLPREWQKNFYGGRYSQTVLNRKTNFAALAKAFGAEGFSAGNLTELAGALKNLPDGLPAVIDCRISGEM